MNKFEFGFNVFNYPIEDFLDYASEHSINHIEINLTKPHSSLKSFDEQRIEKLKSTLNNKKIDLSLHLPNNINIADNISLLGRFNSRYLLSCIELAHKLNVKFINCHIGFFFWFPIEKWQRSKALKRFIKNLNPLIDKCENLDVVLALENVTPLPEGSEHYLLGDNIYDFEFIYSELNSNNLKFCLDTGHANIAEGVDKYLDHFSNKIIAVHYHDNLGNDDAHLAVGKGNIDWIDFSNKITNLNFTGPFISECRNIKPHEAANSLIKYFLKTTTLLR